MSPNSRRLPQPNTIRLGVSRSNAKGIGMFMRDQSNYVFRQARVGIFPELTRLLSLCAAPVGISPAAQGYSKQRGNAAASSCLATTLLSINDTIPASCGIQANALVILVNGNHCESVFLRDFGNLRFVDDARFTSFDCKDTSTGRDQGFNCANSNRRNIKPHVLVGLGDFYQCEIATVG